MESRQPALLALSTEVRLREVRVVGAAWPEVEGIAVAVTAAVKLTGSAQQVPIVGGRSAVLTRLELVPLILAVLTVLSREEEVIERSSESD